MLRTSTKQSKDSLDVVTVRITDLSELHYEPIQSRVLRHLDGDASCGSTSFYKLSKILLEESCIEEALEPRKRHNDVPLDLRMQHDKTYCAIYTIKFVVAYVTTNSTEGTAPRISESSFEGVSRFIFSIISFPETGNVAGRIMIVPIAAIGAMRPSYRSFISRTP